MLFRTYLYGYVIQEPEHATDTTGALIYSHDKNVWLLGDKTYLGPDLYTIDFHVLEVNGQGPESVGEEYNSNVFNNFKVISKIVVIHCFK